MKECEQQELTEVELLAKGNCRLSGILLIIPLLIGCASDRNQRSDEARSELRDLAKMVMAASQEGVDVLSVSSIQDLVEIGVARHYIGRPEANRLVADPWGNPYLWEVYEENKGQRRGTIMLRLNRLTPQGDKYRDDLAVTLIVDEAGARLHEE